MSHHTISLTCDAYDVTGEVDDGYRFDTLWRNRNRDLQ